MSKKIVTSEIISQEYFRKHNGERFDLDNKKRIANMANDSAFTKLGQRWTVKSQDHKYNQHFRWLGRPIIQLPQDVMAMQEIIWKVQPEVIVETGVARGGTLIFHASLLRMLRSRGEAIGIEIALRKHNRYALKRHPLADNIKIVSGSSIDPVIVQHVHRYVGTRKSLLFLDSNHSHDHVLQELHAYNDLVRKGSYIVVSDTFIEDFPSGYFVNRPWDKGNNPATAVVSFLKGNPRFAIDKELVDKLSITACRTGYLKCVRD